MVYTGRHFQCVESIWLTLVGPRNPYATLPLYIFVVIDSFLTL
jgi:hypothetical protein